MKSIPNGTAVRRPTERQFLASVEKLLKRYGWLYYHTYDSRRSTPGFPDIVAIRAPRLLAIELKMKHGRVTHEQRQWLQAFGEIKGVEAYLAWWSDDLTQLVDLLQ